MKIKPDKYQTDLYWTMSEVLNTGTNVLQDSGSGNANKLTSDCVTATSSQCFNFTVTDVMGDGFCCNAATGAGYVNVSYGNVWEKIEGRIYSSQYENYGLLGFPASESYYFQNGVWRASCDFLSTSTTCRQNTSIDIVFVLDSSYDLNTEWFRVTDFASTLLQSNVPSDTRVGCISFGSTVRTDFGLVQLNSSHHTIISDLDFLGGSHVTGTALSTAISMLTAAASGSRQQYIVIVTTSTVDSGQNPCSLLTTINNNGIQVIVVAETSSSSITLDCLVPSSSYSLKMSSFSDIESYTGNVQDIICTQNIQVTVTEVMLNATNGKYWIELYNYGHSFTFNQLAFSGVISGSVSSTAKIAQGSFFVVGNTNPCSSSGCTYGSLSYSSGTSTNFYVNVTYTNTSKTGKIDLVVYSSSFPTVATGYSYELTNKYLNNNAGSNWRESCQRSGSPGVENVATCSSYCDISKCRTYGDTAATCSSSTGVNCTCSYNYYYDTLLRTCYPVTAPSSCTATVLDIGTGSMSISWTTVSSTKFTVVSYYLQASTSTYTTTTQPFPLTYSSYGGGNYVYIATNAIQNGVEKRSQLVACTYSVAPTFAPTLVGATTKSPTKKPTTTAPPTKSPTKSPTYAGCASAIKLDLMVLLDSSASLYDSLYSNWFQEINFVANVVNKSLPENTRMGLVDFSGCSSGSFSSCVSAGKIKKLWSLKKYGINNTATYNAVKKLSSADFYNGYTWTDDALKIAYNEFVNSTIAGRTKMIMIVTDGAPTSGHEPCTYSTSTNTTTYRSTTFQNILNADITIFAIGIQVGTSAIRNFFKCIVPSPSYFFYVSSFSSLNSDTLIKNITNIVCDTSIALVINEVMIERDIVFVEIYNPSVSVSLNGFYFRGLISGTISDDTVGVDQGQYWVITNTNMSNITACNCSHDYLMPATFVVNETMTRTNWWISLYDAADNLIDTVTYNSIYFPLVDSYYTFELILETYDNSIGSNWKESCYQYGTPQLPNNETCPCSSSKCQEKGDGFAYCDSTGSKCICSPQYIENAGVCIPAYPPSCCNAWYINSTTVQISWCTAQSAYVSGYILYIKWNTSTTISVTQTSSIRYYVLKIGTKSPVISVKTIAQNSPQILSNATFCPYKSPTKAPTAAPTKVPTTATPTRVPTTANPTKAPTRRPTDIPTSMPTKAPTPPTFAPTQAPTATGCSAIVVNSTLFNTVVYDSIISGGKSSWRSSDGRYTLGWYSYLTAWVLWRSQTPYSYPDSLSSQTPPFGSYYTWTNLFTSATLSIQLTCLGPTSSVLTPAPTPASPTYCTYLCLTGLPSIAKCYSLAGYYDSFPYYNSSDGIFIHYLQYLYAWAIDANGATFVGVNGTTNTTTNYSNPVSGYYLDYSTNNLIYLTFECSLTSAPTPEPTTDTFVLEFAEIRYDSTPVGFSVNPTENLGNGNISRNFTAFINQPANAETIMGIYISDTFINDTKKGFLTGLTGTDLIKDGNAATTIKMILSLKDIDNSNLYVDSYTIRAWYQLSDDNSITAVDLTNIDVILWANCTTCTSGTTSISTSCDSSLISSSGGYPSSPCTLDALSSWFSTTSDETVQVYMSVEYSGIPVAYSTVSSITLKQDPVITSPTNGGLYGEFVLSPRTIGETIQIDVWLDTNSKSIRFWWLSASFDNTVFTFSQFVVNSLLWGTVTNIYTTTQIAALGSIELFTSRKSTSVDTAGTAVYLGYFEFTVKNSNTLLGRTIANVFSVTLKTALDINNNVIFNDQIGQLADINGYPTTDATIEIINSSKIYDVLLEVSHTDIVNTAYISGTTVTNSIGVKKVSYNSISTPSKIACSIGSTSAASVVSTSTGCTISTSILNTVGGVATLTIASAGFINSVPINVWFPTSITIRPYNNASFIHRVRTPWASVGDTYYESIVIYVYAVFSNILTDLDEVIVNEYISSLSSSDSNVFDIIHVTGSPRYLMQGAGDGTAQILLTQGGATLATFDVTVSSDLADSLNITSIGGTLVTHSKFDYDQVYVNSDSSLLLYGHLQQELTAELDVCIGHIFLSLSDGSLVDISDEPNLQFTSLYPSDLEVAAVDKTSFGTSATLPSVYGTVKIGASSVSYSQLIEVRWYIPGSTRLRATGYLWGKITLPEIINITLESSCIDNKLTRSSDPAYDVFGYPIYCDISVNVGYDDGTIKVFTNDTRTQFTITTTNNLLEFDSSIDYRVKVNSTSPKTAYGTETVEVSIPSLTPITATIDFTVVIFEALTLTAQSYPPGSSTPNPLILNKIQCTNEYQASEARIYGNLTDGTAKDLTNRTDVWINSTNNNVAINDNIIFGASEGTSDVQANFRNQYLSNILSFIVTDNRAYISEIDLYTFSSTSYLWNGTIYTTQLIDLDLTFTDGTIYVDALNAITYLGLTASDLLTFSSSDPDVISVDSDGILSLLGNWWREVDITATSICSNSSASNITFFSSVDGTQIIYPNLYPVFWDVDVEGNKTGSGTGLQFESQPNLKNNTYTFYINAKQGILVSFDLKFWFDDDLLRVYTCRSAGDWDGIFFAFNMDTYYGEIHLAGAGGSAATANGLITIAECIMMGKLPNITRFSGQIIELTYYDSSNNLQHIYNQEIVAAKGYQQIDSSEIINDYPLNIEDLFTSVRSNTYLDCDEYIFNGDTSGCCSSDYKGDASDDCKVTSFDAHCVSLYLYDSSSTSNTLPFTSLTTEQRESMDLTLQYLRTNLTNIYCSEPSYTLPCPVDINDLTYLLGVVVSKYLVLNVESSNDILEQTSIDVLTAYAPFLIQRDANVFENATDAVASVYFEVNGPNNANFLNLTSGTVIDVTSTGHPIIAAEYDSNNGYWFFQTESHTWVDQCIELSILYETYNEVNETADDRKYVFYGTDWDDFSSFSPFEGYTFCFTPAPTSPPVIVTPSPTQTPTSGGPQLLECVFEDNGAAILMKFDRDTDRASLKGDPFSCLRLLTPPTYNKLQGSNDDSRCIWRSFDTLRIELGYEFDIRPGDYLELVGNNILEHDTISPPAKGICQVKPAYNPPAMIARIQGSTHLGYCQSLSLSAAVSHGLAAPIIYEWDISPPPIIPATDNYVIDYSSADFYIPSKYLTTSSSYIVTLTISNYYYTYYHDNVYQDFALLTIYKETSNSNYMPQITLSSPLVINITTTEDLIIDVDVSSDACYDSSEASSLSDFSFAWTQLQSVEYDVFTGGAALSQTTILPSSMEDKKTIVIPSSSLELGEYYEFKVTVTDNKHGNSNVEYVGVFVQSVIPYPKATQVVQLSPYSNHTVTINDFFEFTSTEPASSWAKIWECTIGNDTCFTIQQSQDLNEYYLDEVNLVPSTLSTFGSGIFNISVTIITQTGSSLITAYQLYDYTSSNTNVMTIKFDINREVINQNERYAIIGKTTDYDSNSAGYVYQFDWTVLSENLESDAYGISIIDESYVIDDEINDFVFDGEYYNLRLTITKEQVQNVSGNITYIDTGIQGTSEIYLIATRGPIGGTCDVTLLSVTTYEYSVSCYGWTTEYSDLPLEFNFMILDYCEQDSDCNDNMVCDTDSSICYYETGVTKDAYLQDWTRGNSRTFVVGGPNTDKVMRCAIRNQKRQVTYYDVVFSLETYSPQLSSILTSTIDDIDATSAILDVNTLQRDIVTVDIISSSVSGDYRTNIVPTIYDIYKNETKNKDRLANILHIMDVLYYYSDQFTSSELHDYAQGYVSEKTYAIVDDILNNQWATVQSDGTMLDRDISIWALMALSWSGDVTLNYKGLNPTIEDSLRNSYVNYVKSIVENALSERLVDETPYNVSYGDVKILAGKESRNVLFTDSSSCGGDIVNLPEDYELLFPAYSTDWTYVTCTLIEFNGSYLDPSRYGLSSPWVYFNIEASYDTGPISENINRVRRRRLQTSNSTTFSQCSPMLYTITHNTNTTYLSYDDRISLTEDTLRIPWSQCVTLYGNSTNTTSCYVLTHDEEKTVCACDKNYSIVGIQYSIYRPTFYATLARTNPPFTWTGEMTSVCAVLWYLILAFLFTFLFYWLPTYDKHKAMLAVKKGLPRNERLATYYATGEGQIYQVTRINARSQPWSTTYAQVYKIRLRNDHLCCWLCWGDPGSNISHAMKVTLTILYCLLFMTLLAVFYANEQETKFSDVLYAVLIAFLTILPIWLLAWCISKTRPHELTDKEIDDIIEQRMPYDTRNNDWEDQYSDEDVLFEDQKNDYSDSEEGLFAPPDPAILSGLEHEFKHSNDLQRIYTDIDEEEAYLEEHFMPEEHVWNDDTKVKSIKPSKLYKKLEEKTDDESSSLASDEERRGFEGLQYHSHYQMARDAEDLGFIPMNENEEFDKEASNLLNNKQPQQDSKENSDKHREKQEQSRLGSKIASIFGRGTQKPNKAASSKDHDSKEEISANNNNDREISSQQQTVEEPSADSRASVVKNKNKQKPTVQSMQMPPPKQQQVKRPTSAKNGSKSGSSKNISSKNNNNNNGGSSKSLTKGKSSTDLNGNSKKKSNNKQEVQLEAMSKHQKLNEEKYDEEEEDKEEQKINEAEQNRNKAVEFIACHMTAQRKRLRFKRILELGRLYKQNILNEGVSLQRIVDQSINNGEHYLQNSEKIVKQVVELIKKNHPLFSDEFGIGGSALSDENRKQMTKLLRRGDVVRTVWGDINDDGNVGNVSGPNEAYFSYAPSELRKLQELPERAPSQRPPVERQTKIDDDLWNQADETLETRLVHGEDIDRTKKNNKLPDLDEKNEEDNEYGTSKKTVNLDDIWEETGNLPPELLKKLEDPYDAWQEDDYKPPQKPITLDEEEEYRNRMKRHFKKRRDLLYRKYFLPRWVRFIIYFIIILIFLVLSYFFLYEGNKLGCVFAYTPYYNYNTSQCAVSLTEQERFDYDYSVVECERRNPADAPKEAPGSMPHTWNYRVRFSIAIFITLFASVFIAQPIFVAVVVLFILLCLPCCMPYINFIRNLLCCKKPDTPGFKKFVGGTLLISSDTALEYGGMADNNGQEVDDNTQTEHSRTATITTVTTNTKLEGSKAKSEESVNVESKDSKTQPLLQEA